MRHRLTHRAAAIVVGLVWIALTEAQHDHHASEASSSNETPIKITINPEARVSVSRRDDLPPVSVYENVMELPVTIINEGFVTASLEARLVGSVPRGTSVDFPSEPLKGIREERRFLRVTLVSNEAVDVTIAFRIKNDISAISDRDRVHLLLRCYAWKSN
jgi:hypothetical protein